MKIIFFAELREQLACEGLNVNLDNVSVVDVRNHLIEQQPKWKGPLMRDDLLVSINQTVAKFTDYVHAEDELAFFPPVTGG